jgi:hypothetical protein
MTKLSHVAVTFKTDSETEDTGFRIMLTVVKQADPVP